MEKKLLHLDTPDADLSKYHVVGQRPLNLYALSSKTHIAGQLDDDHVVCSSDWLVIQHLAGRLLMTNVGRVYLLDDETYSTAVYLDNNISPDLLKYWNK